MKLANILLTTSTVLAWRRPWDKNYIKLERSDYTSNDIDLEHDGCRGLGGAEIVEVKVPYGWSVEFYYHYGCHGRPGGYADHDGYDAFNGNGNFLSLKMYQDEVYDHYGYNNGYDNGYDNNHKHKKRPEYY
ncbi:hypothetical protein CONCODRAFT_12800 [Conidiobolus coronatus NRRL 28638]|uniref:Uncharacterized protein n=1 Tax=Conidiobolus coronatus (strain ATCC 28846 / CBS 209.66 / NRRL 28638) TaxID=796925 RepID=A0A137NS45_CONC2|nr:hypothetical protein CONCODRAFT_12800 [Conidiobolus coronatus NRRL 28638]|eukprot:KXN65568.1 hypothetical protein CONCODRAFT_12800 [Conidiobolus coronatus NRRL 28638]